MNKGYFVLVLFVFIIACSTLSYKETVSTWNSHEDVAKWLKFRFQYDYHKKSPGYFKKPERVFNSGDGICGDAANFATKTLNKINPKYNAQLVFISNALEGYNNHWATAFELDGKLYIMDYGAGKKWKAMHGIHGPYNFLNEYQYFLATLNMQHFKVRYVDFRRGPGDL